MNISLATHGGMAAAIHMRAPPRVLSVDGLAAPEADALIKLVDAAKRAPPAAAPSGAMPDAMSYTITIDDGGETTVLNQSDPNLTTEFSALLDAIDRHLP
ncbi:MAG: protealysin inhibitor emfourin [Tardiphaga sp.]